MGKSKSPKLACEYHINPTNHIAQKKELRISQLSTLN